MDQLEFALEQVSGGTFEDLTMAFLRAEGYSVHESGRPGADGGWDAQVEYGNRTGIAHASTQQRWKQKIRDDAESVAELEAERGEDYDLLVFVTNQNVKGTQELDIEDEIKNEYGWSLRLYHRKNLIGEIRQSSRNLANEFLDVDIGTDHDLLREIEELRDNRVQSIQDRNGDASLLPDGPTVALHIIPYGIFTQEPVRNAADIPDPSVVDKLFATPETRGQSKIGLGEAYSSDEYGSYGVQRNDGFFESASYYIIYTDGETGEGWLTAENTRSSIGFDTGIVLATLRTLSGLSDMGFSGSVLGSISLIDAENVKLETRSTRRLYDPPALGSTVYSTMLYPIPIARQGVISDIEPMLSEVWREFGYESGTTNIENDEWQGGKVTFNQETLIDNGDK